MLSDAAALPLTTAAAAVAANAAANGRARR